MKRRIQELLPLAGVLLALGVADATRAETAASAPAAVAAAAKTVPAAAHAAAKPPAPRAATAAHGDVQAVDHDAMADDEADDEAAAGADTDTKRSRGGKESQVAVGSDITLAAGEKGDSVVAVFGDAISAGEVADSVVSVLGHARVTGPVGDSVVSVLGGTHVDAHIGGDVVAVLGDVELGPHAEVKGDVVGVGGAIHRDPAAVVHGDVQSVMPGLAPRLQGLRPWVRECLVFGRPLALAPGLGWAWTLALGFLALYALLALLASRAVERCAATLEERPGQTLLASMMALLLTPVLIVLLCITVIGIAAVPFVLVGLFAATLFGKVVVLAVLGRLALRSAARGEPWRVALAVLAGGAIVLALYCVPVIGFILAWLLAVLGFGVVAYTLALGSRERTAPAAGPSPAATTAGAASAGAGASPSGVAAAAVAAAAGASAAEAGAATATAAGASGSAAPGGEGVGAAPAAAASLPGAALAALPRAGFWRRIAGLLIDIIVVGIVAGFVSHRDGGHVMMLGLMAYAAALWKLKGTTIGGVVCGLRVVRLDGRPMDWATAIVRALSCLLSAAVAGLGFIWIVIDAEKQAWHDKIAGTVVVRAPAGQSLV